MDENNSKEFWNTLRDLYCKEHGTTREFEEEESKLRAAITHLEEDKEFAVTYEIEKPLGVGGAGIVIRLRDRHLGLFRALKLPRPSADPLIESVRNEIIYLKQICHNNIVRLYSTGVLIFPDLPGDYPYFVMEYIDDAQDLQKKIITLINEAEKSGAVAPITRWVAQQFCKLAEAGEFLHQRQMIHFDMKPSNTLIGPEDNLVLTDLGFAKKKSDDTTPVVVGFTYYYAHPDLSREYRKMSDKNRVRKEVRPVDFRYEWDIYACGRSLLQILALIDARFGEAVQYDYAFIYLHLAACRMLDGHNLSKNETDNIRERQKQQNSPITAYNETWLDLEGSDFDELKYKSFSDVRVDLQKLLAGDNFLQAIPEVNQFFPKRIQSSHNIPAPFSQRVRRIIEHPVFSRLMFVDQLGLLFTVYPTATHKRFEHSLGTFRNSCIYVQALFNDPHNPLFRQLITLSDVKQVLLSCLLHDIGQYPLAHELEEVSQEFKHEELTIKFLDNPTKDRYGSTIADIIENEEWGWGVPLQAVKSLLKEKHAQGQQFDFLNKERRELKTRMLRSIIDGPIDVDKLDYLLRDSEKCYIPYGEAIDTDRLSRNLTVIIVREESQPKDLVLGTYERGQSAAETLIFVRYLMYQSVYWHHTARAVRAMLAQAARSAMRKQPLKLSTKKVNRKTEEFLDAFHDLLGIKKCPANLTSNDVLTLLEAWADPDGKELIALIKQRNYFKRVLTLHDYPDPRAEKGRPSLLAAFRSACRSQNLQNQLQEKILMQMDDYVKRTECPRTSVLAPERIDKTLSILSTPNKILCDCPDPNYGTKAKLRFIPEPARLQRNYLARSNAGMRISEAWHHVHFELMEIAAKGRVFCHPDIRDPIMAALGPQRLESMVRELLGFM